MMFDENSFGIIYREFIDEYNLNPDVVEKILISILSALLQEGTVDQDTS